MRGSFGLRGKMFKGLAFDRLSHIAVVFLRGALYSNSSDDLFGFAHGRGIIGSIVEVSRHRARSLNGLDVDDNLRTFDSSLAGCRLALVNTERKDSRVTDLFDVR